jgi:dienelactone hydrolase
MPRALMLSLLFALVAALLAPTRARADLIDYDPATAPPAILTPDELTRYDALIRAGAVPSILSSGSPNGQYMLVNVQGYTILDLDARSLTPIPREVWNPQTLARASQIAWMGDTQAVLATLDRAARPPTFGKTVVDFAKATVTTTPFALPEIQGMTVYIYGGSLLHTPDGAWHVLAYALPSGGGAFVTEAPATFEVQTDEAREERARLGTEDPGQTILQVTARILAINIDTGAATTIGTVPPGTSLGGMITSIGQRPGTNTVSYVVQTAYSCGGNVVRERACRGGGNPTSSFLVQEASGRVPPAENGLVFGTALHIVDLATGAEKVIENEDYPDARFAGTMWTADGSLLLVAVQVPSVLDDRPYPTYSYPSDLAGMVFSPAGAFLRNWDTPQVVLGASIEPLTGTSLMVMTPSNTNRHVYVVDAAAPEAAPIPVFTGSGALYGWELAGELFVYVRGDVTLPGELYIAETVDVAATSAALTDLNATLPTISRIAYQTIKYRTSSGYDVEGIYIYPAEWSFPPPTPKPVVVWQQGGPGGQVINSWGTSVESPYSMLPNYGIPVFMVNGAGRTSNGPQFYSDMAEGRNYGQRDIRDVKEGVDHLIAQGIADPNAVGVTGCSYGGYFTLQSMVEYPDFYKAGNTQCSLNDILYEYNFGWTYFVGYLMGRSSTEDPAEYVNDSPLYRAHQVKHPLLIFHGTNDFLPWEHLLNFHDQVQSDGVPVRFLRARGEGHGFGTLNSQRYAAQLQIDWFRRYLGGGGGDLFGALIGRIAPTLPRTTVGAEVTR